MVEVLTLPDQPRKIVQWMIKRPEGVTLEQVANQIREEEQITLSLLDELVDQGFVQEILADNEINYRINLAAKQGIKQQSLQQTLSPGSPLAIIFNPSGDLAVKTGSKFEIYVTVTNKGVESALIDVFIDEFSHELRQWCDAPHQRIALGPNSISEVLFEFEVPVRTIPNTYDYLIIVDAPHHYPEDTPIRHQAKIQVVPAIETVVRVSDPTFTISPTTSSRSPAQIPPGGIFQININVHNRSDRVDRFRLSCLDFDTNWFSVRYPEGLEMVGLVVPNMGLELNPGEKGDIVLLFNPPIGVLAGLYYPSIRLHSINNPDLMLLDVVYLEILPSYLLTVEMLTVIGKVRQRSGIYEVKITNAGNSAREIAVDALAVDEEKACNYQVAPTVLRLLPGEKANSRITVTPVKWWKRPIFGAGKLLNFRVELENQQKLPIPNATFPGTLIWEPRPWWQFLLVLLTGLGSLALIIFVIWLMLRPPVSPRIRLFNSNDATYQQSNGDFIRLNWQIRNPNQLQSLSIMGTSANGSELVQPRVYQFNGKIPDELKRFCKISDVLTCSNVPTDAYKPGEYVFEMKIFSRRSPETPQDVVKTSTITIEPVPPPKALEFVATKPVYQEVSGDGKPNSPDTIHLNWKINDIDQIQELRIIGRSPDGVVTSPLQSYNFTQGIPPELKSYCPPQSTVLMCRNVPANNRGAGDYIFEMQLVPKVASNKPIPPQKTDVIKVIPKPSQILEFKINGEEPAAKYPILLNKKKPVTSVNISWKVEGSSKLKVELLPAPGNVNKEGKIVYPVSKQPNSETLTLQVTSASGEKVTRAVTIEVFAPTEEKSELAPDLSPKVNPANSNTPPTPPVIPPAPGQTGATPNSSNPSANPASGANSPGSKDSSPPAPTPNSPAPSKPGKLSPLELPPGF